MTEIGQHLQTVKDRKSLKDVEGCRPLNIIWVENYILGGSLDGVARLTTQGLPNKVSMLDSSHRWWWLEKGVGDLAALS